jgi:type IV pilus assembly protein PilQ
MMAALIRKRADAMMAYKADNGRRPYVVRALSGVMLLAAVAAAGGIMLSAAAPVRLVGVSSDDNAVLIEASEPVAYAVSRPDPLTLFVDLRNVSVSDARNDVERRGAVAGVRLEQASAVDGAAIARVRFSLSRAADYKVRSARNTIRVEFASTSVTAAPAAPLAPAMPPVAPKPAPVRPASVGAPASTGREIATTIDRIRASKTSGSTIVTLSGNGAVEPARVAESDDEPRRLVLDFPNVIAKTANQISVDSAMVRKVRVGVNSREPLVTRVVMEIADDVTYHVERTGENGRDLAVVFEAKSVTGDVVMLAPPEKGTVEPPEPPISMEQAIRNAASITPQDPPPPADPIAALSLAPNPAMSPAGAGPAPAAQTAPKTAEQPAPSSAKEKPTKAEKPSSGKNSAPPAPRSTPRVAAPVSSQNETPAKESQAPALPLARPAAAQKAAAPPQQQQQQVSSDAQKKYTGHPVSLDFQGADLRAVLRGFSEISGLNMVIDPDVQGTVDIILNDVPWDQALEVILRGNQLDYTVDGTIVRIARIDTLRKEQDSRQALAKSAADAGTLAVRTFSLSYARATAAAPLVKKAALSPRGDVQIDERTNTLIITDLPAKLETAATLLSTIDRAEPQVEVEARIVQTTRDFARAVGIQWGLNGRVMPDLGNTTPLAFPNQGTLGGRLGSQGSTDPRSTEIEQRSTAVNLGVNDATSAIGLALGAVNGAFNLDVALSALERTGKGRVLSTPRLTTQNNIEAEVAQGIQIPIQTIANNTVTVSFKDAVLVLKVTPQITAANTVIMKITIENATPDFSRQVNGIPPIDTQRANTQVQINDGSTTVIGGIFVSQEQNSNDHTPGLHRVPLLGWLFKRERVEDSSRELLIFITPRILKG